MEGAAEILSAVTSKEQLSHITSLFFVFVFFLLKIKFKFYLDSLLLNPRYMLPMVHWENS